MNGRSRNRRSLPAISLPSLMICRASRSSTTDVRTGFQQCFTAG
jgi:hypothetical protein